MVKKPKLTPSNDGMSTAHTVRIPLWPYLVTPIGVLTALPTAGLAHHFYGRSAGSAGWTGVALTIAAALLIGFTAWASRPRGQVMQAMATGNVVAAFLWIVPAVLNGPFTAGMIGVWLLGGVVMSAVVAVYRIMRQARGDEGGGVLRGEFVDLGDAVKQLKDARLGTPKVTGAKVTTSIEMAPGQSFAEVEGAKSGIASVLDVPTTAVRTIADPDSERRGQVTVVPVDQLRTVPYTGPSYPGKSIARPIILGRREDGEDAAICLVGDPKLQRNAVGLMAFVGMSGAGKTETLLNLATEVLTRHDAELEVSDGRKSGQLPEFLTRHAKRTHFGVTAVEDLVDGLPALVQQRADQLGAAGYKQWQEGCGIPFLVILMFEAATIAKDPAVVDLAESVRSVGICLVLELQRATYDRLHTSARANITTWLVLGVQREDDAEAALSPETIAAGAAPWKWKNTKPGYFYLEAPGIPTELWSEPCRAAEATDAQREAAIAEAAVGVTAPAAATPTGTEAVPAGTDDEDEPTVSPGVDPDDPPDDVDPAKPITIPAGMPRLPFDEGRKMAPGDARNLLVQHIEDLAAAGHDVLRPAQLGAVLGDTGMSGSWLTKEIRALTGGETPLLRKSERGHYRILTPTPA